MEECQICGKPAEFKGIVEGAKVFLCARDSRFGRVTGSINEPEQAPSRPAASTPSRPHAPDFEVVEGFGALIVKARESLGLSRHDLAARLFVMENVLHRIEQEHLKPDKDTAAKLERFLKIKLIVEEKQGAEKTKDELDKMRLDRSRKGDKELTLADVINIKTKK